MATEPRDYPRIVVTPPGPKGREAVQRHEQFASTSYPMEYPLVVARGRGAMVEDVDGNRFLDFMGGIAVAATGHAHPAVVGAIQEQAARFLHICGSDFYYDGFSRLCERLARLAPGQGPKRVFLTNSGTEAVEAAIKLVRTATRRPALLAFTGSFHGRTYGALSLTASKARQRQNLGPFLPEVYHVPYPDPYRCSGCAAGTCDRHGVAAIEDLFARRLHPSDVGGLFVEPIQGEGGYVVPPAGFLPALRALCDRHGILLVADEVQSGVGRTGRMFACEHEGVAPDVLCLAKGLGSGMPIGAMVARESVMRWERGAHGSTFGGNPVCCAAALATLDLVEGGLVENAAVMGERVLAGLRRLQERHLCLGDVRGRGLMIGVEFVKDRTSRAPDPDRVHAVQLAAFHKGLLLLGAGPSALRLAPPLVIDEVDVTTALALFDECLAATAA
jgi:4-aminobutyrate aminotransferase